MSNTNVSSVIAIQGEITKMVAWSQYCVLAFKRSNLNRICVHSSFVGFEMNSQFPCVTTAVYDNTHADMNPFIS